MFHHAFGQQSFPELFREELEGELGKAGFAGVWDAFSACDDETVELSLLSDLYTPDRAVSYSSFCRCRRCGDGAAEAGDFGVCEERTGDDWVRFFFDALEKNWGLSSREGIC